MADLIDRQTAYDVLTEFYHHTTDVQHSALREALNKVPSTEQHGKWIPCKERLPEPDTDVLISDYTELLFVGRLDENSMNWLYDDCILHDLDDVKAWMPLPEPYETKTMDECTLKPLYLDRTGNILECDKCIFRNTDECQYKGG